MITGPFVDVAVACAGLILGSFFNVLIWRLPRGESIAWPGSHCPACNRPIKPYENIPVLSYIFLRGKCAGCHAPISLQYPLVEAATAALALVLWHWCVLPRISTPAPWWTIVELSVQCAVLVLMVPVCVIDILHYIIPDAITLPALLIGLAISFMPGGVTWYDSLIGAVAGGGSLLVVGKLGEWLFRKEDAMGMGDVKLMSCIGALWGWQPALLTILFGSFLGAAAGLTMMATKSLRQDHRIPFGPYLAAGAWIAVLAGGRLVSAYLAFAERLLSH
jgi:leader peptidase (prepilin peptidase) / N-methyltransferase